MSSSEGLYASNNVRASEEALNPLALEESFRSKPTIVTTPFFTIVEDPTAKEQHHPHVHYVFSDDVPDIVTAAVKHALNPDGLKDGDESFSSHSIRPRGLDDERNIIVDMNEDGRTVLSIHSLSPVWQVTDVTLSRAPTSNGQIAPEHENMMLRITGLEDFGDQKRKLSQVPGPGDTMSVTDTLLARIDSLSRQFEADMAKLQLLANDT